MVKIEHITKDWREAGSFPAQVNLYGLWDEHSFLTKMGDLGAVLKIGGIDYESLDHAGRGTAGQSGSFVGPGPGGCSGGAGGLGEGHPICGF